MAGARIRPGDWLILGLGLALLAALWARQAGSLEGRVIIRLDGQVFTEASLRLNRIIEVPGPLGLSRVEIRDGRVRVAADPEPAPTVRAPGLDSARRARWSACPTGWRWKTPPPAMTPSTTERTPRRSGNTRAARAFPGSAPHPGKPADAPAMGAPPRISS
jgi:hypothetical protein